MFSIHCTPQPHDDLELDGSLTRITLRCGDVQVCYWVVHADPELYQVNPALGQVFVAGRLRELLGADSTGRMRPAP